MDTSDSSDDDSAYSGGPVRMMIGPRRRAPPERRPFAAATRRDYFALWVLARHTRLPADAVKVVFRDFLDCGATLELTFPDVEDDDARANARNALQCLVWSFARQPEVSVLHLPSKKVFRPLRLHTGRKHTFFTLQRDERRPPGTRVPGFVGAEAPDVYEHLVKRTSPTCDLPEDAQNAMIHVVTHAATVRVADGADGEADLCVYGLRYGDLAWEDCWEIDGLLRDDPIFKAIDDFTRGRPHRWRGDGGGRVRFRLGDGTRRVVMRNTMSEPGTHHRGAALFAAANDGPRAAGEHPIAILASARSDGPPWQEETEVRRRPADGTFGLDGLMQAVMRTKSHKAENACERFHKIEIDDVTDDAIFVDIQFDYGS